MMILIVLIVIFGWSSPYILSHNLLWSGGLVALFLGMIIGVSRYGLIQNDTPRYVAGIIAILLALFIHAVTVNGVMALEHI